MKFCSNMLMKIYKCNPTIFYFIKPLLVVAIIRIMKIKYIFAD